MKVDKDFVTVIERLMEEADVSDFRFEMGGKHPKLVFSHAGRSHSYTLPGSPSDHRAVKNMARDLRGLLGLATVKPDRDELPPAETLAEARRRVAANPPSAPTAKDTRTLALLDADPTSALELARRAGAADPAAWGVERLERLVALGLAIGDGVGRYRRRRDGE